MRILVPTLAAALTTGVMAFATTASALPLTNAAALNNVPSMHMEAVRFDLDGQGLIVRDHQHDLLTLLMTPPTV